MELVKHQKFSGEILHKTQNLLRANARFAESWEVVLKCRLGNRQTRPVPVPVNIFSNLPNMLQFYVSIAKWNFHKYRRFLDRLFIYRNKQQPCDVKQRSEFISLLKNEHFCSYYILGWFRKCTSLSKLFWSLSVRKIEMLRARIYRRGS